MEKTYLAMLKLLSSKKAFSKSMKGRGGRLHQSFPKFVEAANPCAGLSERATYTD